MPLYYGDCIMGAMVSQITSITVVYSTVYSGADQRIHKSSASLAFVWGIHRWSVNSPHKWPVTRKMFPFDDVIMKRGRCWVFWMYNISGSGQYMWNIIKHNQALSIQPCHGHTIVLQCKTVIAARKSYNLPQYCCLRVTENILYQPIAFLWLSKVFGN